MNDSKQQRDKELDDLLEPFRTLNASPEQLNSWKQAVQHTRTPKTLRWYQLRLITVPQLLAAVTLAFVIGAFALHKRPAQAPVVAEIEEPSATVQYIFAKAE